MAIKVNGTTVIDDSRNLSNVGGLKTINGTSILGSGNISAGASTTFNAVGTYCLAWATSISLRSGGDTRAGSGLRVANTFTTYNGKYGASNSSLSGTWRLMGQTGRYNQTETNGGNDNMTSLWVRIS